MNSQTNAAQVVASALCLDALRRIQASGPHGIWGEELEWHLKCWGTDAYSQLASEGMPHCTNEFRGDLGWLLKPTEKTANHINYLTRIEGVPQLVDEVSGPLPDLAERGARIVGAFQEAMRLHSLPTSEGTSKPMEPIAELLRPLFGGMLMGHMFSADGKRCKGITFYCQREHHAEAPFGVLLVRFDVANSRVFVDCDNGHPEGTNDEVLVDDSLTLGAIAQFCRQGGWAHFVY